jgi:hypothetical protein
MNVSTPSLPLSSAPRVSMRDRPKGMAVAILFDPQA